MAIMADNDTRGPNGLPSVTSTLSIVADEPGSEVVIERASTAPPFRLLHAAAGATLTLQGLTLRGGDVSPVSIPLASRQGAAIYNEGASLTLTQVLLTGNRSRGAGAIYTEGGALTVTDSRLITNRADEVCAVRAVGGTVTFARVEIADNLCNLAGSPVHASNFVVLWMEDTRIAGHRPLSPAGALHLENGSAVLTRVTVERNETQGPGAIRLSDSNLLVRDSSFVANSSHGGTGPTIVDVRGSTVDVINTTFFGNAGSGGAASSLFTTSGASSMTVVNSTMTGNSGTSRVFSGQIAIQNSIVTHTTPPDPNPSLCPPSGAPSLGHNVFFARPRPVT